MLTISLTEARNNMILKEQRFIDFINVRRKQSFLSKCVPNHGDWERATKPLQPEDNYQLRIKN